MNRIFCLETEWDQTMHDLKKKSTCLCLTFWKIRLILNILLGR